MNLRMRWWLLVMDALAWMRWALRRGGRPGRWARAVLWPAYLWAVGKASDATDWGADESGDTTENRPW